jgi:hypothetical protein
VLSVPAAISPLPAGNREEAAMNVRWDAVVTNKTSPFARRMPDAGRAGARTDAPLEVRVKLFGMLVGRQVANPLVLRFAGGCVLRDVIDELGRQLGREFLRSVLKDSGESLNTCRLFLEGEPVEDLSTPISGGAAATVEIILFREIEGG